MTRVPEFEFIDLPTGGDPSPAEGTLLVEIPRGLITREDLFRALVEGLKLPGYFGWNFDAFEECLNDLSWLPHHQSVCLVHGDIPLDPAFGYSRRIYLQVLRDAILAWNERQPGKLRIVFPQAYEHEAGNLLIAMT